MAQLLACRRTTDPVGGGIACQHEVVAHTNVSGLANAQTTRVLANTLLVEYPADAGASLPEASADGATAGGQPLLDVLPFREIWLADFEFSAKPGENPEPVCLVAWELRSGRKLRLWRDEFGSAPPYSHREDSGAAPRGYKPPSLRCGR
jgi:hypothetical protein